MSKIRLLVHRSQSAAVLHAVQKMGVVELTEVADSPKLKQQKKTTFEFNYVSSRLDFAVEYLTKFEHKKGSFKSVVEGDKIVATEEGILSTLDSLFYTDVIDMVQNLEETLNNSRNKIKELNEEALLLGDWTGLEVSLGRQLETEHTKTLAVHGNAEQITLLTQALEDKKIIYNLESYDNQANVVTVFKQDIEILRRILGEAQLEIVDLPRRRGTPLEEIERIGRAQKVAKIKITESIKQLENLTKHLPKLKLASDYLRWKKEKHNVVVGAHSTEAILVFEGWCLEKKLLSLKKAISNLTPLAEIETLALNEEDIPPVEIANSGAMKPFEIITRLYGLPGHKDIDPTPFLASFFIIFFGLSLTDVGYGLFLFLLTSFIFWRYKVPSDSKPFLGLLMFGGLSSFVAGLLFGGYLGIDMSVLPTWLQALQKFDPIASPLPVLYLSLTLGVIQVLVGLILKIVREAKNGALLDGLLDRVPWIVFFATIGLFVANRLGALGGVAMVYTWLLVGSMLVIVVTQGRAEKSILQKLFKGVISLYDSVSYFSDVLSYSRILALGLATSALAFAVNLIAYLVRDMVPVVGPVIMVVILVIGHIFNLVVNLLGAFIHSARLQFVEFFGKFIEGSGRAFRPFKQEGRYVINQ